MEKQQVINYEHEFKNGTLMGNGWKTFGGSCLGYQFTYFDHLQPILEEVGKRKRYHIYDLGCGDFTFVEYLMKRGLFERFNVHNYFAIDYKERADVPEFVHFVQMAIDQNTTYPIVKPHRRNFSIGIALGLEYQEDTIIEVIKNMALSFNATIIVGYTHEFFKDNPNKCMYKDTTGCYLNMKQIVYELRTSLGRTSLDFDIWVQEDHETKNEMLHGITIIK